MVAPAPLVPRRPSHARTVDQFLTAATQRPASLVVDGEACIGKTTFWLDALAQARERGFLLLVAQTAAAESELAYAGLADLLGSIELPIPELPGPQQRALTAVLSHTDGGDHGSDHGSDWRVLAEAFLTVIERLGEQAPVLIAIDDLQWLDMPSRRVLGYAARRLVSRVGVLATVPADAAPTGRGSSLKLSRPDAMRRITVLPMSLSGLHELFLRRLQRSFTRPAMARIHELSGGNPYYALELARQFDGHMADAAPRLPDSIVHGVRNRLDRLSPRVREVLLAAACARSPTVGVLAVVTREVVNGVPA
ncbi:AAA family ATPase [Mycobacterium saskatchewanense]|nr:AAA family ATPase [Mycobacterium saskatchewanense]